MAKGETDEIFNFYLGHINGGRERVPAFERVIHVDAYQDIDIHYTTNNTGIKYDFVIKPNANPANIELHFNGNTSLSTNSNGELEVGTSLETVLFPTPKAFEINNGAEVELSWTPQFIVNGNKVTFSTGAFDPNKPLILRSVTGPTPPAIPCVIWSTYFGRAMEDIINATDIDDSNGDIYMCGHTKSAEGFPVTPGAQQEIRNGLRDAFAFKFDVEGRR